MKTDIGFDFSFTLSVATPNFRMAEAAYPKDESLRVSHETIYPRGALKQELIQHLRSKRRIRRSRHSSVHGHSQGKIVDAISIRERPAEVEDRAIPVATRQAWRKLCVI